MALVAGRNPRRFTGTAPKWTLTNATGVALDGVQAVSTKNVIAVGTNSLGTVILRWNGKSWRTVPAPEPNYGELNEITAGRAQALGRRLALWERR